jgi:hypothetical protein
MKAGIVGCKEDRKLAESLLASVSLSDRKSYKKLPKKLQKLWILFQQY